MPIEEFTYSAYCDFIELIRENGYEFSNYKNYYKTNKPCIIRHDVDVSLKKAAILAELEYKLGFSSTYFIMLRTDFYNALSQNSMNAIFRIISLGHEIGLHFDEASLTENCIDIRDEIKKETDILSSAIGYQITAVSMHRPSEKTLNADYEIDGIMNSYSKLFFKEFKYLSDSRMHWRENAEEIISSGNYKKLQIVIHPFWYTEESRTIRENIVSFIKSANSERKGFMYENIKDLESIIGNEDKNEY